MAMTHGSDNSRGGGQREFCTSPWRRRWFCTLGLEAGSGGEKGLFCRFYLSAAGYGRSIMKLNNFGEQL